MDEYRDLQRGKVAQPVGIRNFCFYKLVILITGAFLWILPSEVLSDETRKTFVVDFKEGQVDVPNKAIRVEEGDYVELSIRSDVSAELHLHGYDIEFPVEPGKIHRLGFEAHTAGRFPITRHDHGGEGSGHGQAALLHVEVYPK